MTWFSKRVKDFISAEFNPIASTGRPIKLAGNSTHGIEFNLSATLSEDLTLNAAYTWTDGKDPNGETLVRHPKHVASASLNYPFLAQRAKLKLQIQYNGKQDGFV